MSKRRNNLGHILVVGAALAALSGALHARDPGINQPGVRGGTAGRGAPGVGVRDPGINQPGAAGNVGVGAPGVGVRDPGINQPGAVGNVGGVARRRIIATSVFIAALPPACTTVVIEGTTLHQCGATYYQPSGNRYMEVNVE